MASTSGNFDPHNFNEIPKPRTASNPALIEYGNKLYMVYRANKSRKLYYSWWEGDQWEGNKEIKGYVSYTTPQLAVHENKLYMIYRHDNEDSLWYTFFDGDKWSVHKKCLDTNKRDIKAKHNPAIASLNGKLLLFYVENGQSLTYHVFDGDFFTPSGTYYGVWQENPEVDNPVSRATVYGNKIYLVFSGNSGEINLWSFKYIEDDHGKSLRECEIISPQKSGESCWATKTPAISGYKNKIYLLYAGKPTVGAPAGYYYASYDLREDFPSTESRWEVNMHIPYPHKIKDATTLADLGAYKDKMYMAFREDNKMISFAKVFDFDYIDLSEERIKHVFVLMLENRSFDHMLGFSGITGYNAENGAPTEIEGCNNGSYSNSYENVKYRAEAPADYTMSVDPGHELWDVLAQLCGEEVKEEYFKKKKKDREYPGDDKINNSGFVHNYVHHKDGAKKDYNEIMKCYSPEQLPILNTLANEFAVCDHWFCSLPGPTVPNRFFSVAASSAGMDYSPGAPDLWWRENIWGYSFQHGTIFDSISKHWGKWRVYRGDPWVPVEVSPVLSYADIGSWPIINSIAGMHTWKMRKYKHFKEDLQKSQYPYFFTFIEPHYGMAYDGSYKGGTSQHPMDDVRHGEHLIKHTYEAIRNSPHWENSLLIITWDEHGGFYDHVKPPKAVPPGDKNYYNEHGFQFDQYGPRVPAVIVSPWIKKNTIDHRIYDHSSIPATVKEILRLPHFLTKRDENANTLTSLMKDLITLNKPRLKPDEAPLKLPEVSKIKHKATPIPSLDDTAEIGVGNLLTFLHNALRIQLELSQESEHEKILADFKKIKTKGDSMRFLELVQQKIETSELHQ